MFVNVNEPLISEEAKKNILEAVETGWISSAGKFVKQFEEDFAKYLEVKHAITVTNGTAAIHVGLLSLGIEKGDEVIVPAFTMAGSWLPILYIRAKPIFVDCEIETFNIDVNKIEQKITEKTKAIMPVHIYGHACEMDRIEEIAKKYNLKIIEDAAEVHGGEYKGRKCGTMGDVGCFSFYGNKIITTGEGGMIVTNNDEIDYKCRKIKDLYHSDKKRFIHDDIGYNYRMTNMQAAIGCGELKNINTYIAKKQKMAELYEKLLKDIPGIRTPITRPNIKNVFWMYGILVDQDQFGLNKDGLREKLKEKGIDTRDFFYPPNEQPVLVKKFPNMGGFPNTKFITDNGMYLPSGLTLTGRQIDYVCRNIQQIYCNNHE